MTLKLKNSHLFFVKFIVISVAYLFFFCRLSFFFCLSFFLSLIFYFFVVYIFSFFIDCLLTFWFCCCVSALFPVSLHLHRRLEAAVSEGDAHWAAAPPAPEVLDSPCVHLHPRLLEGRQHRRAQDHQQCGDSIGEMAAQKNMISWIDLP